MKALVLGAFFLFQSVSFAAPFSQYFCIYEKLNDGEWSSVYRGTKPRVFELGPESSHMIAKLGHFITPELGFGLCARVYTLEADQIFLDLTFVDGKNLAFDGLFCEFSGDNVKYSPSPVVVDPSTMNASVAGYRRLVSDRFTKENIYIAGVRGAAIADVNSVCDGDFEKFKTTR